MNSEAPTFNLTMSRKVVCRDITMDELCSNVTVGRT